MTGKRWLCSRSQPSSLNTSRWKKQKNQGSHRSRLSLFAFSGSSVVIMKVCNRTWHHNYILPVKRQCLQQAQGCLYFLSFSLSFALSRARHCLSLRIMCHLIALKKKKKCLMKKWKKVNCFKLPVTDLCGVRPRGATTTRCVHRVVFWLCGRL